MGYMADVEARTQQLLSAYGGGSADDAPTGVFVVECRLEALNGSSGVAALLSQLGMHPTAATTAVIGNPVNRRRSEKAKKAGLVGDTSMEAAEAAARGFAARCDAAGIVLPQLPHMARWSGDA